MTNFELAVKLLPLATWETLYMVFASAFFAFLIGMPLGIILTITDKGHLNPHSLIHKVLGVIVNIGRSFPFAILMISLIPFTRWIVGTSLGTTATIVPLSLAAAPFIARVVEGALKQVDKHLVEASIVMGSTTWQIIWKVLLKESLPSLILGMTLTLVNLIGFSAMAGLAGGGGLGKVAIQYGYNLFNGTIMAATVIELILLVGCIQWLGNSICRRVYHKWGKA